MALPEPKPLSTRLHLLVELHQRRHSKLKTLADRLDVTIQAVSGYLQRLTAEGLVERSEGAWRPTAKGTAHLGHQITELRRFLDEAAHNLRIINETLALAAARIRQGDDVGLVLRQGRLVAVPGLSARSRGRARTDAAAGELVLVSDLEGILELFPAPLTFLAHPDFPAERTLARARRELPRAKAGHERLLVAAHAISSLNWAQRLKVPVDLEFAPLAAAQDAARRGVPVAYLVPRGELAHCVSAVREADGKYPEPIPVRSVEL